MKILHYHDLKPEPVALDGAKDVTIRWLIAKKDGAPRFAMRLFEVQPGGHSPLHVHATEHEVFILDGEGVVWKEGEMVPVRSGTAVFVSPNEKHQFMNRGMETLRFLCMVPLDT